MASSYVPIPPTHGIDDTETRSVLDAVVKNVQDLQGTAMTADTARAVAMKALSDVFGTGTGGMGGGSSGGNGDGLSSGQLIDGLTDFIRRTLLYQKLGDIIQLDFTNFTLDSFPMVAAAIEGVKAASSAGVASEATTRTTKDLALASAINNIWAKMGGSTAVIADGGLAAATPTSATATKWNQVLSSVTDPNTGSVSSAYIGTEARTYASSADSTFNAIYTVKAQISTGGTTVTGTAASVTSTRNIEGSNILVLASSPSGTITAGMTVIGPGIPGGTTVNSFSFSNVTLSNPLNANAVTTANAYSFTTASLIVGGFGLSATSGAGSSQAPSIDFGVRADKFYVAATSTTPSLGTQLGAGNSSIPFIVVTSTTTVGGITYQPGVYMKTAFIANGSIDVAKIYYNIHSNNFNGTFDSSGAITSNGTAGWAVDKSGLAVFQNVYVRGNVQATSISGQIVDNANISVGATSAQYIATTATGSALSMSVVIPTGASGLLVVASYGVDWLSGGKDSTPTAAQIAGAITLTTPSAVATTYNTISHAVSSPAAGTWTVACARSSTGGDTISGMYLTATVFKR